MTAIPDYVTWVEPLKPQKVSMADLAMILGTVLSTTGLPAPGYLTLSPGVPEIEMQFSRTQFPDQFATLRQWAEHFGATVTATATRTDGEIRAGVVFHHQGVKFDLYAYIVTADPA